MKLLTKAAIVAGLMAAALIATSGDAHAVYLPCCKYACWPFC